MTPPSWQALFISPPFFLNAQLSHNRRHLENRHSVPILATSEQRAALSSNSFATTTSQPLAISLLLRRRSPPPPPPSSPPSPGQLLIRGRNDRCFARQKSSLVCLSANSRCAVHIYFRGLKKSEGGEKKIFLQKSETYLLIYGWTLSPVLSVVCSHHCDNRFGFSDFACLSLVV